MKKVISIIMLFALTLILTVGVSGHTSGQKWGDVPKTLTPVEIDGKLDDVYKQGLSFKIDRRTDGKTGGSTGVGYLLHDGKYIYYFVSVTDPEYCDIDLSRLATSCWTNEGVEFTIDFKNDGSNRTKITAYWSGESLASGDGKAEMFKHAGVRTDKGFDIEIRLELQQGAKTGSDVGIQCLINDMTEGNKTRGIIRCPSSLNCGDNEVAKFDYVTLSDKEVAVVETTAPPAAKAPDAAKTPAAQTADITVIAVLCGLLSFAGTAVCRRRR